MSSPNHSCQDNTYQKWVEFLLLARKWLEKSRKRFDLATKIEIINAVETGMEKKSEIARRYNLPRSTLSTIPNKEKFEHLFATSQLKPEVRHCRPSLLLILKKLSLLG